MASLLDATVQALKEQRIRANSNSEEQACSDFIHLCSQRERIINETAKAIYLQLTNKSSQPLAPASSAEEWHLVDDTEVDELLELRSLVRRLRDPLGTLEWRNCTSLNRINATASKDLDNPLSLDFLVRTLQAQLHLRQQPGVVREVFYSTAATVLGTELLPYFQQMAAVFKQFQIEPLVEPRIEPHHQRFVESQHAAAPYQAIQRLRAVESNQPVSQTNAVTVDRPALQQAITTLQTLPPAQRGWSANSFVQQLQQAGAQLSPRQCDDAGLVADLFQHLEQQTVIASGVKPALRRLMTPVAHAAI
ncbi:MAG: diguanylate cyclase, partial [Pseudomonas sp.]|nr:diguanylate cyclase [Pseudomonas sp.]